MVSPMAVNIEVSKQDGESMINMIRRFSKRVQGAGIINRVRGIRYHARKKSKFVERKHALKSLRRREEVQELIKLGKMIERPVRGSRR
jgi:hypothetical protein